jgi:hypothetical protein
MTLRKHKSHRVLNTLSKCSVRVNDPERRRSVEAHLRRILILGDAK